MEQEDIRIRSAGEDDAEALLEIYAPYVENTAITFEYAVPSPEEFRARIRGKLQKYPYLVAQRGEELLGYAYTSAFVGRAAYDYSAETTIYLKQTQRKQGLGRKLYRALEDVSAAQGILNLNACIGYPEAEDAHLTKNSVQFHRHLGYTWVGQFHRCGYKFGTWYDMVWMEKLIGEHPASPAPLIPFPELSDETLRRLGIG